MNFFEHHIGDYDQATAHLSAVEDGIYSRLIRWYMASECPIPADMKVILRRVRVRTKNERAAVQSVLAEFFQLRDGFYHQHRCDEGIAKYKETAPTREARKENARERQRRARARRQEMFDTLRQHGVVPPFDTKTSALETLMSRVMSRPVTPPVTRDVTATHYPLPSNTFATLGMNTPSHDQAGGGE